MCEGGELSGRRPHVLPWADVALLSRLINFLPRVESLVVRIHNQQSHVHPDATYTYYGYPLDTDAVPLAHERWHRMYRWILLIDSLDVRPWRQGPDVQIRLIFVQPPESSFGEELPVFHLKVRRDKIINAPSVAVLSLAWRLADHPIAVVDFSDDLNTPALWIEQECAL